MHVSFVSFFLLPMFIAFVYYVYLESLGSEDIHTCHVYMSLCFWNADVILILYVTHDYVNILECGIVFEHEEVLCRVQYSRL